MTVVAIVQARMSSSRLPGKVLADVGGRPLLSLLLARLGRARSVDEIVVATSTEAGDDPIEALARSHGVRVHRGPLDDVLKRVVEAVGDHDDVVVRITADCPLIDPEVVDDVIGLLAGSSPRQYASNIEPRTFPDGLDVEAMSATVLRDLDAEVDDPELREHVTLALRDNPQVWPGAALTHDPDLGELRWTVDTQDDLDFVRAVAGRLGGRVDDAGLDEILAAVRAEPSLADEGLRG